MSAPSKSLEKEFKHQLRDLLDQCPYFFYLRDDDFDSMSEGITKGTKTITLLQYTMLSINLLNDLID
jgi:hypothetical protein